MSVFIFLIGMWCLFDVLHEQTACFTDFSWWFDCFFFYLGKRFASGGADKSVIIWTSKLEGILKYT